MVHDIFCTIPVKLNETGNTCVGTFARSRISSTKSSTVTITNQVDGSVNISISTFSAVSSDTSKFATDDDFLWTSNNLIFPTTDRTYWIIPADTNVFPSKIYIGNGGGAIGPTGSGSGGAESKFKCCCSGQSSCNGCEVKSGVNSGGITITFCKAMDCLGCWTGYLEGIAYNGSLFIVEGSVIKVNGVTYK